MVVVALIVFFLIYYYEARKFGTTWVRRKKIPFILRGQILSISEEQRRFIEKRGKKRQKKSISSKKTAKNP